MIGPLFSIFLAYIITNDNCILYYYYFIKTYDGSDYLSVYLGVGRSGYRILHFHTYHAKHCCWEYEAEIMSVFWHSNHELGDWGFRARITRIG